MRISKQDRKKRETRKRWNNLLRFRSATHLRERLYRERNSAAFLFLLSPEFLAQLPVRFVLLLERGAGGGSVTSSGSVQLGDVSWARHLADGLRLREEQASKKRDGDVKYDCKREEKS